MMALKDFDKMVLLILEIGINCKPDFELAFNS